MKIKNTVDRIFGGIVKASQVVAACFLIVMIIAVTVQVIGRVCHFKVPVTEEIGTYSLIWMTYTASIAVTAKGEHLTVDLFLNRYNDKTRRVMRILIDAMIMIFCGMLIVFGFMLVGNKIIVNGRTPALQISRVWVYLSVPIAMTFNTVYTLYDLIVAIYDFVSGGKVTAIENAKKAEAEAALRAEEAEEEAAIRAAMLGDKTDEKED
mgnify:CR=1 FL=1